MDIFLGFPHLGALLTTWLQTLNPPAWRRALYTNRGHFTAAKSWTPHRHRDALRCRWKSLEVIRNGEDFGEVEVFKNWTKNWKNRTNYRSTINMSLEWEKNIDNQQSSWSKTRPGLTASDVATWFPPMTSTSTSHDRFHMINDLRSLRQPGKKTLCELTSNVPSSCLRLGSRNSQN